MLAHIPRDGTISCSELANATGVPMLQLRSIARMVMTSNLLCEPAPNEVAHNAVSALFTSNSSIANWAGFMVKLSAPVATAFAEATKKWGVTDKKNETAFNAALKTDLPFFNFLSQSSGLADCFASYMQSVQSSYGTSLNHLLSSFDWAGVGEGVVIDVGISLNPFHSFKCILDSKDRLVDPLAVPASHSPKLFPSSHASSKIFQTPHPTAYSPNNLNP